MKQLFLLLCISCSLVTRTHAQAPFSLSLPPDARSTGMGDLGLATTPDAAAQHWNIAKYAFAENKGGVEFSYTPWLRSITDDMNLYYISGYAVVGEQAISASFRYFAVGDIVSDNNTGVPTTYSPNDLAVDIGYSRQFGRLFSLGLAFRYVSTHYQERYDAFVVNSVGAFAADLGAYFRLPVSRNQWTIGAALKNVGTKLDMGDEKVSLPMNAGIGTQYAWKTQPSQSLRFALDVNQPLVSWCGDDVDLIKQMTFSGGVEYDYLGRFFVRAGYFYNNPDAGDRSHATVGAGLCFFDIHLDCSYLIETGTTNSALKNTLRFTLGYTFGKRHKPLNPTVENQL